MNKQLHVISTGQQTQTELVQILAMIHPYIDAIHLREKTWSARKLIEVIHLLQEKGVTLSKIIVNDRVDVAHVMKTGGVQLAHHSINLTYVREMYPALKVGCSVHSVEDAVKAENEAADYILYGHLFETSSKLGIPARGLNNLQRMQEVTPIPIIGIGGITPKNTSEVINQGIAGIAVMSGILLHENPLEATKNYRYQLDKERNHA